MNITEAAQTFLHDRLVSIAKTQNSEALQALLSGANLPAMARDDEPAEQIIAALESGNDYAHFAQRIAQLLAKLLHKKADTLASSIAAMEGAAIGGSDQMIYTNGYLEDETYIYNLFLLASGLPRDQQLFGGLKRFFDIGFTRQVLQTTTGNRVGLQLRRSLAEQQTDLSLREYFQDLLEDKKRPWNPGRRTELLEAWHGLLGSISLDNNLSDALQTIDQGLLHFHNTVEAHPESIDLLELALWRLDSSFPLDSPTWVAYLRDYWRQWPELLQDIAVKTWPGLAPQALDDVPPLPIDLAPLWEALPEADQSQMRDCIKRKAADEGRTFLTKQLVFKPPVVKGLSPQEVRKLLNRLAEYFWPHTEKVKPQFTNEPEQWQDDEHERTHRKVSFDRLSRMDAVNRTLSEIDRRLAAGDEAKARRFLEELIDQQRHTALANGNEHTAKTLAKAATMVIRYGFLDWAEALLREACDENPDDEVSANGLADVLKMRGELDAAEQQYRQNIARWPNNRIAVNGLANVLRKRKHHTEALSLLPIQSTDCHDYHLRAMILLDLGRITDARTALDDGLRLANNPYQKNFFQQSLTLLEIRAQRYSSAIDLLAELPSNVIPLDLFRLHAEIAQGQSTKADELLRSLEARKTRMNINEDKVFELVRQGFGLSDSQSLRQPSQSELDDIFDAEIELQLAA